MPQNKMSVEAHLDWVPTTATVISSTYHYARLRDVNLDSYMDQSFFLIEVRYMVNGQTYQGRYEQFEPLDAGSEIWIFYNPFKPSQNTLTEVKLDTTVKVLAWIGGIALAGFLIYIERHLNIPPASI